MSSFDRASEGGIATAVHVCPSSMQTSSLKLNNVVSGVRIRGFSHSMQVFSIRYKTSRRCVFVFFLCCKMSPGNFLCSLKKDKIHLAAVRYTAGPSDWNHILIV